MKSTNIALGLTFVLGASPLFAVLVSLPATVDNAGIIEDGGANQDGRNNTLWGSVSNPGRQRNGLVTFAQLSPTIRAGILDNSITVDSVTLKLTSTANAWASTTLNFMPLDAANADFVSNQADWANKSTGTPWVGGAGGGTRGQIFGTLTSVGSGTSGTAYSVTFTGSQLNAWLSSATAPSLLIEETVPGAGAQTRFATLESTGTGEVEPILCVEYTPIPEPSSALLAGLATLGLLRRRR